MNTGRKKSDSIGDDSASLSPKRRNPKKNPKKQIGDKKSKGMYVGIDLHKKFLQVAVMDGTGKVLRNDKVINTHQDIKKHFADIPLDANIVMIHN